MIPTEGKLVFAPSKEEVPTKNGLVNVTAFAPAPLAITLPCFLVSGSDIADSPNVQRLIDFGIKVL